MASWTRNWSAGSSSTTRTVGVCFFIAISYRSKIRRLDEKLEAVMDGVERQLEPVGNPEFMEHIAQMIFYGLFADGEHLRNLPIPVTLAHQGCDFPLSRRKPGCIFVSPACRAGLGQIFDHTGGDSGV